jgi:hypothetical protein
MFWCWWGLFVQEAIPARERQGLEWRHAEVSAKAGGDLTDDMLKGPKSSLELPIAKQQLSILHHTTTQWHQVCVTASQAHWAHGIDYMVIAPPTAANMGADLKDTTAAAAPAKVQHLREFPQGHS